MNEQITGRHVATVPQPQHTAVYSDVFATPEAFEHAQRVAKVFASSKLIPAHLQGNIADCLIALQIARRLGEEPLTVMQNIFIVSGRPGWYTSYVIARANKAGVFKGRITWDTTGEGETLSVTAKAALADTGEVVTATADMRMARAEQWTKNAKYTSMAAHMLKWRSAAMLVRLYAPEVMLGMPVVEELETMPAAPRDVTPRRKLTEQLDALAAKPNGDNGDPPHDPETGEIIDQSDQALAAESQTAPAAAGKAASEAKPSSASARSEAVQPGEPTSAAEYAIHAHAWIANLIDPDSKQWVAEKNLRNRLGVDAETRDELAAAFKAKVAQLKPQE